MLQKLTADLNQDNISSHEKIYGGYNDPLPNMVELTIEEFLASGFFTWCLEKYETRQINPDKLKEKARMLFPLTRNYFVFAQVFYFNSPFCDGYVFVKEDNCIRYFVFNRCEHIYSEISQNECKKRGIYHPGNYYHVSICSKCGEVYELDTSG